MVTHTKDDDNSAKYELRHLLNHTFTTDHDYLLALLQQMVDVCDVLYTMLSTHKGKVSLFLDMSRS